MVKTVIDASKPKISLNFKELLDYRDLFWVLAWRDVKVRYAQTSLGLLWAIIQPLATLLIFTLIFGKAIKVDTGDVPYPIYALSGMIAWSYFAYVLSQSGQSIIGAQEMVKKVYFPRLIIPLSKAVTGFVDFAVTLIFLIITMIYYQYPVNSNILLIPIFFVLNVLAALGVGIWLSSLTIRYRDFQHIVPFMVQVGLYVTPIAYPASMIPSKFQVVYHINPMAGIVEGFRFSILGEPLSQYIWISYVVAISIFLSSLYYFRKVEKIMADIV